MGFFSDLFAPGNDLAEAGFAAAQQAKPTFGNFFGPAGINAGFRVGPGGGISLSGGLGAFNPILQGLLQGGPQFTPIDNSAATALGQFAGTAPEISSENMGLTELGGTERAGLSDVFQSALGIAKGDPFEIGASVTSKLRPGLERAQNRLRNTTFDQLFAKTGGAVSSSTSPVLEGLQKQFAEQNQALDVTGLNIGQNIQQNAIGRLFGAQQNIAGLDSANAARAMQLDQLGLQRFGNIANILQAAGGLGLSGQELELQRQMGQFGSGLQGVGTAANIAQLPLAFQSALQAMQGLKSNVDLGIGGAGTAAASQIQSPFLNFLETAGGFMTGFGNLKDSLS